MRAHLKAVRDLLGANAYLTHAPLSATLPFYVVELVGWDRGEVPVSATSSDLDLTFRVKAAGATPDAAMNRADAARTLLVPNGVHGGLTVPGRSVTVQFLRHEADYVDRDTTLPGTNTHTAVSVDSYRLVSTPT